MKKTTTLKYISYSMKTKKMVLELTSAEYDQDNYIKTKQPGCIILLDSVIRIMIYTYIYIFK